MKRVLFLTNYPSPYRVHFFDELGKYMDVTVLYSDRVEDMKHRNAAWFEEGDHGFQAIRLTPKLRVGRRYLCFDVLPWLKKKFDAIVVCGYSSPTAVLAMAWLRLHRIPFYMEVDGGLIRQDGKLKHFVKKSLVCLANRWLSSGVHTTKYLVHYGAKEDHVSHYHFSSLYERDILDKPLSAEEKEAFRMLLGIEEKHMILAIGQFIHRKGFDVLLHAAKELDPETGIYIVGGETTDEYRKLREELGLTNVHFLSFQKKDRLALLYKAADMFVLPTREDIWGLVINEALAYGLPTLTTDRCVAGLELIEDGVNGYVVAVGNAPVLAEKIRAVLASDLERMGAAALEKVRPYTLENMARTHVAIFESGR